jgi:NitT/TauT family transport system permease protein
MVSPAALPRPSEIPIRFFQMLNDGSMLSEGFRTTLRAIIGLLIGFPAGIIIAISIFFMGLARPSGEFFLDFVRSIPISCLVPLIIALVGVDTTAHICMAAIGVSTITAVTLLRGLSTTANHFSAVIRLYRPNKIFQLFKIILPGAFSHVLTALKLSMSSALVLVILAEMFMGSTAGGLGRLISDKTYGDDRPGQFAAILFTGMIGYLLNLLLDMAIARLQGVPNASS